MSLTAYTAKTWVDYADTPDLSAANVQCMDSGIAAVTAEVIALEASLPTTYQPISAELSALAGLSTAGYAKRGVSAGSWGIVTSIPQTDVTGLTAALASIPLPSVTSPAMNGTAAIGTLTTRFALADHVHPSDTTKLGASAQAVDSAKLGGQLPAYYATASSLSSYQTVAGMASYSTRAVADTLYQPLDADLTAIAALGTTGFVRRTAANTWAASAMAWADISGVISYGTAAGTVAQGNDSRVLNGQTAYGWGNHASAGYALASALPLKTAIAPAMNGTAAIGSDTGWATGNHVHPTDTTRLAATAQAVDSAKLGGQPPSYYLTTSYVPTWASLSGVPSTFTPSAHTHAIADVTGLLTALNAKQEVGSYVLTNDTRLTDARVPVNNAFYVQGQNGSRTTEWTANTPFSTINYSGFFNSQSAPDSPVPNTWTHLIHSDYTNNDGWSFDIAANFMDSPANAENYFMRVRHANIYETTPTGNGWRKLWHDGNFDPATTTALAKYLPLTGGTLVGALTVNGGLTVNNDISIPTGHAFYCFGNTVAHFGGASWTDTTYAIRNNGKTLLNDSLTGTTATFGLASMATWYGSLYAWFGAKDCNNATDGGILHLNAGTNKGELYVRSANGKNVHIGDSNGNYVVINSTNATFIRPIVGTTASFTGIVNCGSGSTGGVINAFNSSLGTGNSISINVGLDGTRYRSGGILWMKGATDADNYLSLETFTGDNALRIKSKFLNVDPTNGSLTSSGSINGTGLGIAGNGWVTGDLRVSKLLSTDIQTITFTANNQTFTITSSNVWVTANSSHTGCVIRMPGITTSNKGSRISINSWAIGGASITVDTNDANCYISKSSYAPSSANQTITLTPNKTWNIVHSLHSVLSNGCFYILNFNE